MQKTVGDLFKPQTTDADEAELIQMLAQAEEAYENAWNVLVSVKAKAVAGLSPGAKAAIEITGRKADLDVRRIGDAKFEIGKRLQAVRSRQVRGTLSKRLDENLRELTKFRGYAAAINAGEVRVDEATRRKLVRAIGLLEVTIAESMK